MCRKSDVEMVLQLLINLQDGVSHYGHPFYRHSPSYSLNPCQDVAHSAYRIRSAYEHEKEWESYDRSAADRY